MTDDLNRFDSEWRRNCRIDHIGRRDVHWMIERHYLHCWPAIPTCILGMWAHDMVVGLCVFALPPRETSKRYGGETWELARLWLMDLIPRNAETWLIAQAVRHIKRDHKAVDVLVSYADPSVGHAGTIYKAANWLADGQTERSGTPRSDYIAGGLRYSRRAHIPVGATIERVPRVSKWRFYLPLKPRRSEYLWK